ncbi:MAG: 50S ribosomal protein L3, partial [Phycisphaerae bacterium]|nr:50S ribosomal protein L3 [Phycisphaerae bacterium]
KKPKQTNKAAAGHFKKAGVTPKKVLREYRVSADDTLKVGDLIKVESFQVGERVDVIGTSKGRGTAGLHKRHHFGGGPGTHGSNFHRRAGSIARGLAAACAAIALGCNTEPMDPHYYHEGNPYQRYAYDEVKQRLRSLRPGMPRYEVLVRLGSPAENRGDTWLYLPEEPRFLIPGDFLEVKFDGDFYVSHRFRPIVLGEKVTDP